MVHILPLSEQLRPKSWSEIVGQKHILVEPNGVLYRILSKRKAVSLVFWGPPGCGKTTIARLYIKHLNRPIEEVNPYSAQTSDIRKIIQRTQENPLIYKPTILWIDEVHRLTRPQQDILLPCLEGGSIILVAATTENPSFQLTPALLSRLRVITLKALDNQDLSELLAKIEQTLGPLPLTSEAKTYLIQYAQGDARLLINSIEQIQLDHYETPLDEQLLADILQKKVHRFDPTGEDRYQLISALHKSIRGSDCNAALYWLCRLITQGEDIRYIARRLIRMAVEDIGLSDPQALSITCDALRAYEQLGSPEGDLVVAQTVIYLALAPKSNAVYSAYKEAMHDADTSTHLPPPAHIINAPNNWMKKEGYGQGYVYDHDLPSGFSGQSYWPSEHPYREYYAPKERGFEREMAKRLVYFTKLRDQIATQSP